MAKPTARLPGEDRRWKVDNRERIKGAVRRGVEKGLMDIADRIAFIAWQNADKFTKSGDLQRGISTSFNKGSSFRLMVTKVEKDGREHEVAEGKEVRVPETSVKREGSKFSVEFGCYVPYAAAVEYGTNPHVIEPDPTRTFIAGKPRSNPHLRFTVGGDVMFSKRVMHPGTSPQPFMQPAVDQVMKYEAKAIMARAIKEELSRAVGRPATR